MEFDICADCPINEVDPEVAKLLAPIAISYSDCPFNINTHWRVWADDITTYLEHPDSDPAVARAALEAVDKVDSDQLALARTCSSLILRGKCLKH